MDIICGSTYRDTITGFNGVCVSHIEHMNGEGQSLLQPRELKPDGGIITPEWFNDSRLEAGVVTDSGRVDTK